MSRRGGRKGRTRSRDFPFGHLRQQMPAEIAWWEKRDSSADTEDREAWLRRPPSPPPLLRLQTSGCRVWPVLEIRIGRRRTDPSRHRVGRHPEPCLGLSHNPRHNRTGRRPRSSSVFSLCSSDCASAGDRRRCSNHRRHRHTISDRHRYVVVGHRQDNGHRRGGRRCYGVCWRGRCLDCRSCSAGWDCCLGCPLVDLSACRNRRGSCRTSARGSCLRRT